MSTVRPQYRINSLHGFKIRNKLEIKGIASGPRTKEHTAIFGRGQSEFFKAPRQNERAPTTMARLAEVKLRPEISGYVT